MAERTSTGLLTMMLEPTPAVAMTLPAEVREKLAELELELSEGKLTTCKRTKDPNMLQWWFKILFMCMTAIRNHRPLSWLCGSKHANIMLSVIPKTELLL